MLEDLVARLDAIKGSGGWQKLAEASGVNYFTIARICRGEIPNPGIVTCEKLIEALNRIEQAAALRNKTPRARKVQAPGDAAAHDAKSDHADAAKFGSRTPIAVRHDGTVVEREERGTAKHKEAAFLRTFENRRGERSAKGR